MSGEVTVALTTAAGLLASVSGAIAGTWISRQTARQLDRRPRERVAERERAEIRAAAAFIRSDLDVSRRRLREALADDEWHLLYRLATQGWQDYGVRIATALRPDDVAPIAHCFARIEVFERAMAATPKRRYGALSDGALRISFEKQMRVKVDEIVGLSGTALGLLETLAPHERQLPLLKPGQRKVWPPEPDPPKP
ncbi:MAG: hypothetical protein ACLGG5_08570 [Thermoleophilia bacterium]